MGGHNYLPRKSLDCQLSVCNHHTSHVTSIPLCHLLPRHPPFDRYVALETLADVVHLDVSAVQRHRAVIVECLHDVDTSIR